MGDGDRARSQLPKLTPLSISLVQAMQSVHPDCIAYWKEKNNFTQGLHNFNRAVVAF